MSKCLKKMLDDPLHGSGGGYLAAVVLLFSLYAAADTTRRLPPDLLVDSGDPRYPSIAFWSRWPIKFAHIWQLELARM